MRRVFSQRDRLLNSSVIPMLKDASSKKNSRDGGASGRSSKARDGRSTTTKATKSATSRSASTRPTRRHEAPRAPRYVQTVSAVKMIATPPSAEIPSAGKDHGQAGSTVMEVFAYIMALHSRA